ncbi:hypothetical protein BC938DRAFT_481724 [Jimgerdemannia flammicorona]|uniref:PPPDE domain-containing protein n=1 Tax=Jimgerdemannia flammicorona TaxID=994334 RepID=A0A433QFL7_9FUNG|nr:hypothetical protein BC938DRAFT_481724 [Jimgerdemannia flammicorona]
MPQTQLPAPPAPSHSYNPAESPLLATRSVLVSSTQESKSLAASSASAATSSNSRVFLSLGPELGRQASCLKSINMGYTSLTESEVQSLIKEMSKEWTGNTYNLLTR